MQQIMTMDRSLCLDNSMRMEFDARSENEGLARMAVAAFMTPLDPTVGELSDVKTAVSDAVTNAILHGYENCEGLVVLQCGLHGDVLCVEIIDEGVGIADIEQAMQPMFTSKPELNRSGMGFSFMEAFMDDVEVYSQPGLGTTVRMFKKCGTTPWVEAGE